VNKEVWVNTAEELYKIQQYISHYKTKATSLSERLKTLSNFETTVMGGFKFAKSIRKGSIDYRKIEILKEIDIEVYRKKDCELWKLHNIKEKERILKKLI